MKVNSVVLVLANHDANFDALRRAVQAVCQFEVLRVDDVPIALARVAGGGVEFIFVDVTDSTSNASRLLDKSRASALGVRVILWSASGDPGQAIPAQPGVSGYLSSRSEPSEWSRILSVTADGEPAGTRPSGPASLPGKATTVAVMGAKGGVGTTTVAMNLAAALTTRGSVVLAEIRPCLGSLKSHFHPGRMVRGLSQWCAFPTGAVAVESLLWPVPGVDGLRILFGASMAGDGQEIEPVAAAALIEKLSGVADFLVVDLPVSLSAVNRAILGQSQYLAVVIEPNATCLRLAVEAMEEVHSWERTVASIGVVVVRRSGEGGTIPLAEIEDRTGLPILSVIPPALAECLRGERERMPLLQADPGSLVGASFSTLARRFASFDFANQKWPHLIV